MNSTENTATIHRSRMELILRSFSLILWLGISLVALSYYGLQDLDLDAGIEWTFLLRALNPEEYPTFREQMASIWEDRSPHYHHQLIQPILYLSYLPVAWIQPPLNAARIVYAAYYLLYVYGVYMLLRELFAGQRWLRLLLTIFMVAAPSILSHLTSFEDNLIGYGPLLFGVVFLLRFLRERAFRHLVGASGCMAFAFLVGFTYLSWILAMCAGPVFYHIYRDGLAGWRAAIGRFTLVTACCMAWVLPLLLWKDWWNAQPAFTMLEHSFTSPATLYPQIVRELTLANLDRQGIEYMLRALLATLSGMQYVLVYATGRSGLYLALAVMALVIYVFARALRRQPEPRELAMIGVCLMVAGFQMLYLAIGMEPTVYERNDWLVLWIPLAVFATHRHLPRRVLFVSLAALALIPPVIYASWYPGRESNHKEIHDLLAKQPRIVFDHSRFNYLDGSHDDFNFSEIGAVELAGLERCYVLAAEESGFIPQRCEFLIADAANARRIIEAESAPFALTRAASIRLGYIRHDLSCESLVESYTDCARKWVSASAAQADSFRQQVRELCGTHPELLACYEKAPDNCQSLHICVVTGLQGRRQK